MQLTKEALVRVGSLTLIVGGILIHELSIDDLVSLIVWSVE